MNLTSAPQIKQLLANYGLRPKKRLGQNFLIDRNVLTRLVDATGAGPDSRVLEIGPGLGVVTRELAQIGAKVVCVEADKDLAPILNEVLKEQSNVEIVIADFLKVAIADLTGSDREKWIVVGNLPYYITTPIIIRLIDAKRLVSSIFLMVQREVAQRLQAEPGSEDYGAITVFVQYHCEIESIMKVSRNVFYPIPDVDSELIRLVIRDNPKVEIRDEGLFFRIVRAAFGKRRKTLLNALSTSEELGWDREIAQAALDGAGIDAGRRGETLSLEEFGKISDAGVDRI